MLFELLQLTPVLIIFPVSIIFIAYTQRPFWFWFGIDRHTAALDIRRPSSLYLDRAEAV